MTLFLDETLIKKAKVISLLYKLTIKQNSFLLKNNPKKALFIDDKKDKLLKLLTEIETSISKNLIQGRKYSKNAENTIKNINLLFDDLIKAEKENEILVSQYLNLYTGKHVNEYNKIKKQNRYK